MINTFVIYIKSYCEAPDYEDVCEAESIEQASEIFQKRTGKGGNTDLWGAEQLVKYIQKVM